MNSALTTTGPIYADGTLRLGGKGFKKISKQTKREVHTLLHTNRQMQQGGGFAVSDTGGIFDFKDGYITYEPLEGAHGFRVNSKLRVDKKADFHGDIRVRGALHVDGGITFGKMDNFDQAFAGFNKKHNVVEERVKELERTNALLTERLER